MDVYSIMYCYDECSTLLDNIHSDYCLCKAKFTEGNNNTKIDSYTEIRKSIQNHNEKIKQIDQIYQNYDKYITFGKKIYKI